MILYTLYCDGKGCLRSVESAFGEGIQMPAGWSEFRGTATISNGPSAAPTARTVTKHYCWDCREYMREHGVMPHDEQQVVGPDLLPSGKRDRMLCRCGYRFSVRSEHRACPSCGELRAPADPPRKWSE